MSDQVEVVDYDPKWPIIFEKMKAVFIQHLGKYVIDIQHVGSTSVPGLAAKPKIDIDIIVADQKGAKFAIADLKKLGYNHVGDLGVKDREAFRKANELTPNDGSGKKWMDHNLYVCTVDGEGLKNHLAVRDYLLKHPDKAKAYGDLKKNLASSFPDDIDAYCTAKTDFIIDILKETGLDEDMIKDIERANKGEG